MLEQLKEEVLRANLLLPKYNLCVFTWGNVSGIDRQSGLVVIKPSGVEYDGMTADDMVVVDLHGNVVEGKYRPSSDTPTHIELYKEFENIGGVVHTHSPSATAFAQANMAIPPLGTTHADYFYGEIPCTRILTEEETVSAYEQNTGKVIIEKFNGADYNAQPGTLVAGHGVFSWGKDAGEAVYHAAVIEEVAKMAYKTLNLNKNAVLPQYVLDKHYNRKHGKNAYYGQK